MILAYSYCMIANRKYILVEETAVKIGHYVESTNKGLGCNSNNILNNIGT